MNGEKFTLLQYSVNAILGLIEAEEFVIPEIQRPFVWSRTQVKDLIDSLYNGYPTGYIITWKNPDVRTKDGKISNGKKVLIDGQQRITALMAAISGREVLDDDFNLGRVKIAFNPLAEEANKRFAVQDASHLKDKKWIPDIAEVFKTDFNSFNFAIEYSEKNEGCDPSKINDIISSLIGIKNRQLGVIELEQTLDIDEVTEIFIRINSKGTVLSQSDFVMSKMAADGDFENGHGGSLMRKTVDYFCHLAVKPDFYSTMIRDKEFMSTKYADKIKWLSNDYDDIYDPDFTDMLRVSFMHMFGRGRLSQMVSLLSGRDFETREFKEEIVVDSYSKLDQGLMHFINEYDFKQFVLAIKGAGFVSSKLLSSQMSLDFAYTLYHLLKADKTISQDQIKRYVQKWFVLSYLSGRYTGSPESVMDRDLRSIASKGFATFLAENEASVLSDSFWEVTLPQRFETSTPNSPAWKTFVAAQIKMGYSSLLMDGTKIEDLIKIYGDVHHIFPKAYLKENGVTSKVQYNQVANYTYLDSPVNKEIGKKAPCEYFGTVVEQCKTKEVLLGNIDSEELLAKNLAENAIPEGIEKMTVDNYEDFLDKRRIAMAQLMKVYYKSL